MATTAEQHLHDELKTIVDAATADVHRRVDDLEVVLSKGQELGDRSLAKAEPTARPGDLIPPERKFAEHPSIRELTGRTRTDDFRLGAVIAAAATGKSSHLSDSEGKALAGGVGSSGGYLLPEGLSADIIDLARNRARVIEAGAQTVPMLTETVSIPRLDAGVVGTWRPENAAVAEDQPDFGRIRLQARTCAVTAKIPAELFEDLSEAGFDAITNEITQSLSLKLDYAALRGAGAESEPLGIRNTANVTVTPLAANGTVPADYDFMLDAIGAVEGFNGTPTAAIYSPRTAKTLRKLVTGLSGDKTKLTAPPAVAELRHLLTNQVPNTTVQGSSGAVCSEMYVGDFSQVVIGVRPQLGVRVLVLDRTSLMGSNLQIAVVGWLRADVGVRHPEHLHVTTGIKET